MYRYIIKVLMYSFPIVVDCFGYPCGLYTLLLEIKKNTILQRKKRVGARYSIFPLIVSFLKISLVFFEGHIELQPALGASLQVSNIAEDIKAKIKIYQPAPLTVTSSARTGKGAAGHLGGYVSVYESYW